MAHHPSPIVLHIIGTEADDRGQSCKEHHCCGDELQEDVVVRLRKVQIQAGGGEATAIAAVWVTDGMDRCRVGFLQRHMVAHAARCDDALAQVTRVLSADDGDTAERRLFHKNRGCCYATIISHLPETKMQVKVKKEKEGGDDEDNKQGGRTKRTAACITLE
jgi:hypothetical protein